MDTHIDLSNPSINYGDMNKFYAKTDDNVAVLTRFDVSTLPANIHIVQATLRVFVQATTPENTPITFRTYRMLRSWQEDQATWSRPNEGSSWAVAGANGVGSDRSSITDGEIDLL